MNSKSITAADEIKGDRKEVSKVDGNCFVGIFVLAFIIWGFWFIFQQLRRK